MTSPTYRWAERWLAGYWLLTGMLLLFGPHASQASLHQALLQFLAALGLFIFSGWCDRHPRWGWLIWLVWLPGLLWSYSKTEMVQQTLGLGLQDARVQAWEEALWKVSPAMTWSQNWPSVLFSEILHLCYLIYYLILPVLIIRLLRRERDDLARLCLAGGISTLLCCYFINILVPVQGPRHLYPPLAPELHGPFWQLCHMVSRSGAAAAAAFPSAHTALAVSSALLAWRWDRGKLWFYVPFAAGIVSATIYGRFHYTVDAMAGALVALFCAGMVIARDPDA